MKRYLLFTAALLILGSLVSCGQEKEATASQEVTEGSMKIELPTGEANNGNPIPLMWRPMFRWVANAEVDSLGSLFSQGMYFAIKDQGVNDPNIAYSRLKKFYQDNRPISFTYKHNGSSNSGLAQYAIGELATDKTNYRVTMVLQEGRIVTLDFELP